MGMVPANFKGEKEKSTEEFDGWLDTQSLTNAIKWLSPDIPQSRF
jgi:hypothetical protein